MKKLVVLLLVILGIFSSTSALAAGPDEQNEVPIEKSIILIVQEKDPRIAYQTALMPLFGPISAANYVSMSPVEWEVDEQIKKAANQQLLWNILEVFGGFAIDLLLLEQAGTTVEAGTVTTISYYPGFFTALGIGGSVVHNHYFGQRMAESAVKYNKDLHEKFKWSYPLVKIGF